MTSAGRAGRSHHDSYRWVQKYGPELDKHTRWYRQVPDWQASSWRVDETYIRVGGRWCYLYRSDHRRWPDPGLLPLSEAERGHSDAFPGQGPQIQCVSRVCGLLDGFQTICLQGEVDLQNG